MSIDSNSKFIQYLEIVSIVVGLLVAGIIFLNFLGIQDIDDIRHGDIDNFKPQMEVTYSNVTFYNSAKYTTDYKSNLALDIETYTPHISKIDVKLIDYNFSSELDQYLNHGIESELPQSSTNYSISMSDYSYSIDKKHTSNVSIIPIKIEDMWIDPYHTVYDTSFKLGTIGIQIELIDIQDSSKNMIEYYSIPIYWIN